LQPLQYVGAFSAAWDNNGTFAKAMAPMIGKAFFAACLKNSLLLWSSSVFLFSSI